MRAETVVPLASAQVRPRFAVRLGNGLLGGNTALVFAFLYLPVLILIVFSFNSTRSVAVLSGFSWEWYVRLIHNDELLASARNSLIVGVISTLVSTAIGTLTALGMDRYRFRLRIALDANLYLPIVIPEIVMGISLLLFFNQALFPFIQSLTGYRAATGLHTIIIAHIAFNIPFVYVIVRARLADFDRSLEEAAQDLGADEWHTFTRVTLPLLMPGILGGALLAFTLSLDDYLITAFTKGVTSQTMPIYIYSLVRRGVTPEINALSTALLLGSIGLVALSLAAQSGVPLFVRAMPAGAALGLGAYALVKLVLEALNVGLRFETVFLFVLLIVAVYWSGRALKSWSADFGEAKTSGKALSCGIILVVGAAVLLSALILVG